MILTYVLGITAGTFVKLLERHNQNNYSHSELIELFSLNRQIFFLSDIRWVQEYA